MVFLELFLTDIFRPVFLFLVHIMFGVFRFKSGFLLSVNHKIVGQFMIDVVEVNMRKIVFRWFFIEMVQWIFFTWKCTFILIFNFFLFKGIFTLLGWLIFIQLVTLVVTGNLFVDDGIDIIGFFMRLNRPCFFLLVEVYWIFHSVSTNYLIYYLSNPIYIIFHYYEPVYLWKCSTF